MTNKEISTAVQSANDGQPVTADQKPRNYFIPTYSIRLMRDGSVKAETKLADSPERVAAIVRAYWGEGELDRVLYDDDPHARLLPTGAESERPRLRPLLRPRRAAGRRGRS